MLVTIVASIACFIVGGILSYVLFKYGLKAKYDNVLKEAETEAEVIKKNKLLEVKEKFLNKKADLEKEVALRNQKIQQAENKLKQREMVLSQRQEEIQRKRAEADAVRENLEAQLGIVDKKKEELDKLQHQEIEKLEALSGLSADEAKERLVESLKEEAKTQAQSYINDIMDDAKLTASKEAKRIVIQSIQRVATETAIENSVTVFHIESDEIKGRIIDALTKIDNFDYDKNRFEQEMIFYIEKLDINEEKHRLDNHLKYFLETMQAGKGQGKKLGFISQEMGREINTLGSKSNQAEMQRIVVRMKDELEQIKEQVLNVM